LPSNGKKKESRKTEMILQKVSGIEKAIGILQAIGL